MFARAAHDNSTIQEAMEHVIFYQINAEKGEGLALSKRYHIAAYPTFIAINGAGEITDRWVGYGGPDNWAQSTIDAAANPATIVEKTAAYGVKATVPLAKSLASNASADNDFRGAVDYLNKARELDASHADNYANDILMAMYYGSQSGAFSFDEVETELKGSLDQPDLPLDQRFELTMMLRSIAQNNGISERAIPYITSAMEASRDSQDEDIMASRAILGVDYALLVTKDKDKALELFRAIMPENWQDDANQLNRFAWWCFENDVNLKEANTMALKGLKLADSDAMRSNILDTAAEICHRMGQTEKAVAHMKRAVELNPDKPYFQQQLARFEKAVADKSDG